MEFKHIQKELIKTANDYKKKFNITVDREYMLLKLQEEMGELAEAILISGKQSRSGKSLSTQESKKKIAAELADIIGTVVNIANYFDIDLEEAITKKWITKEWIKYLD